MATKKTQRGRGEWVFVPFSKEEQIEADKDHVLQGLFGRPGMDFPDRCKALEQYWDYFPEEVGRQMPAEGSWILVVNPPHTEYTVPPFSFWFAEPWPMSGREPMPKRVKVLTPKGELGLFPREYRIIPDPEKFFEFVGEEITVHFFGNANESGVPSDKLFYLRSRGIAKRDAMTMLVGEIKSHGVLWMECGSVVQDAFVRKAV